MKYYKEIKITPEYIKQGDESELLAKRELAHNIIRSMSESDLDKIFNIRKYTIEDIADKYNDTTINQMSGKYNKLRGLYHAEVLLFTAQLNTEGETDLEML